MASMKLNSFLLLFSLTAGAVTGELYTTHFHFYMHDVLGGPNPLAVRVVTGPLPLFPPIINFGDITVFDDPLTEGGNVTSKLIGRAQGLYSGVGQDAKNPVFLIAANIVFAEGEYNGSTVAILARDAIMDPVREFPVIGGTGVFRLARGYALIKTYQFNPNNGDAILEWDLYVMHN